MSAVVDLAAPSGGPAPVGVAASSPPAGGDSGSPPAVRTNGAIRALIDNIWRDLGVSPLDGTAVEEHSRVRGYTGHNAVLSYPTTSNGALFQMVIEHPELCGCDALTDELVLHG